MHGTRGRSLLKMLNARAGKTGTSAADIAVALMAVTGALTALCSLMSCRKPQPLPIVWLGGSAKINNMGSESA